MKMNPDHALGFFVSTATNSCNVYEMLTIYILFKCKLELLVYFSAG